MSKRAQAAAADTLEALSKRDQEGSDKLEQFTAVVAQHGERQDRDERSLDQVQATKELTRNLAHEIKNPLGGIRGAAIYIYICIYIYIYIYLQTHIYMYILLYVYVYIYIYIYVYTYIAQIIATGWP